MNLPAPGAAIALTLLGFVLIVSVIVYVYQRVTVSSDLRRMPQLQGDIPVLHGAMHGDRTG